MKEFESIHKVLAINERLRIMVNRRREEFNKQISFALGKAHHVTQKEFLNLLLGEKKIVYGKKGDQEIEIPFCPCCFKPFEKRKLEETVVIEKKEEKKEEAKEVKEERKEGSL